MTRALTLLCCLALASCAAPVLKASVCMQGQGMQVCQYTYAGEEEGK